MGIANIPAGVVHWGVWGWVNILQIGSDVMKLWSGVIADTVDNILEIFDKSPFKKEVRKAIGDKYRSRFNTFTSRQKERCKRYLEPLKWKGSKRNSVGRPAKLVWKTSNWILGGAWLGVMTALDATWRVPASPINGIANWFRKKDKKVHLWKNFQENQKKRVDNFTAGIQQFDQVASPSSDAKNRTETEKVIDKVVNSEKVEENKKEVQKVDTKEKKNEKDGDKKDSEKLRENKNKKTELEKIEEKNFKERERQYGNNKEFIKESEDIIKDFKKTWEVEEPEWGETIRKNIIKTLKESKWKMTEENIKEYKKYEDLFEKVAKEKGEEYLKNNEWKINTLLWFYKIIIFLYSTEEDHLYQCFMDVHGALYYKFKNNKTSNTEKQQYKKLLQKFDTLWGKVFPKKSQQ